MTTTKTSSGTLATIATTGDAVADEDDPPRRGDTLRTPGLPRRAVPVGPVDLRAPRNGKLGRCAADNTQMGFWHSCPRGPRGSLSNVCLRTEWVGPRVTRSLRGRGGVPSQIDTQMGFWPSQSVVPMGLRTVGAGTHESLAIPVGPVVPRESRTSRRIAAMGWVLSQTTPCLRMTIMIRTTLTRSRRS